MAPPPKAVNGAATRAIDGAISSLQHLGEQERMITSRVMPAEDPIEAVFKPPESLPHSYLPASRPSGPKSALAAPVGLRIPKSLMGIGQEAGSAPLQAGGDGAGGDGAQPLLSYQKVRRWDMLPKHAWLQAAESGQAPGPGFRDVSATQTMRSYRPKGLPPLPSAKMVAAPAGELPEAPKAGPSSTIGSHYSPAAYGLAPSALHLGVPPRADEEAEAPPPELDEDEVASTFLPLEFFDGGEMEPMPDALWEKAEEYYNAGKPFCARSKFYGPGGRKSSMEPCEVIKFHPLEAKFEVKWVHTGKHKLCTRLNLLFDEELEPKFWERVHKSLALRARFEADARYFLFSTEQVPRELPDPDPRRASPRRAADPPPRRARRPNPAPTPRP